MILSVNLKKVYLDSYSVLELKLFHKALNIQLVLNYKNLIN